MYWLVTGLLVFSMLFSGYLRVYRFLLGYLRLLTSLTYFLLDLWAYCFLVHTRLLTGYLGEDALQQDGQQQHGQGDVSFEGRVTERRAAVTRVGGDEARNAALDAAVLVALISTPLLAVLAVHDTAAHGVTRAGGAEGEARVLVSHVLGVAHEGGGCMEDSQERDSQQEHTGTHGRHHFDL